MSSYPFYLGGGLYNVNSSATLTNVTISGNSAGDSGAGMYNDASSPTLTNVTISGNIASQGGGMYNEGSNPSLTNITISGNSASQGGGIYNDGSSPTLTNVTISGNSASQGGGMYNYQFRPVVSSPQIRNSIFWGDTGGEIYNAGTPAPASYSIVQGGYPGTGNKNVDPLFVTAVPLAPSSGGDLHLKAGSPALGASDSAFCPATDRDGNARRRPAGTACDLGAYQMP